MQLQFPLLTIPPYDARPAAAIWQYRAQQHYKVTTGAPKLAT